jgi:hypothetical protein
MERVFSSALSLVQDTSVGLSGASHVPRLVEEIVHVDDGSLDFGTYA